MFLLDGPADSKTTILLAHGAGGAMDSASMTSIAQALAREELRVARFEFKYMAERRTSGGRKPPPRAQTLLSEYEQAVDVLGAKGRLVIGGKSMGGRVASMVADTLHESGRVSGLLCLGYPFHPIGKPDQLRTAHLADLATPTLIVQGARDPLGTLEDVGGYMLSSAIEILWLADGDHDLKPRKTISGFSAADHVATMARRVRAWSDGLPR